MHIPVTQKNHSPAVLYQEDAYGFFFLVKLFVRNGMENKRIAKMILFITKHNTLEAFT